MTQVEHEVYEPEQVAQGDVHATHADDTPTYPEEQVDTQLVPSK